MNLETVKPGAIVLNTPGFDSGSTRKNWIGILTRWTEDNRPVILWKYNLQTGNPIKTTYKNGEPTEFDFNQDGTRTYTRQWAKKGLTLLEENDAIQIVKSFLSRDYYKDLFHSSRQIAADYNNAQYMVIVHEPSFREVSEVSHEGLALGTNAYFVQSVEALQKVLNGIVLKYEGEHDTSDTTIYKRSKRDNTFKLLAAPFV